MWQDPPEPPKPKKKKTKTQIDDEGNEVIIELSEDESSDEEEKVKQAATSYQALITPTLSLSPSLVPIPAWCCQELPHHRIVRNIRRFFAEVGDNKELRSSTIENMLLALPTASKSK